MEKSAKKVCDFLEKSLIKYSFFEHKPIYTIDDVKNAELGIPGIPTKNLFLRDKKKTQYFMLISDENKKINLKHVSEIVGKKNLTFASEEELNKILGLEMGDVGPFGIINDNEQKVLILLDRYLVDKKDINLSANSLTTTITIDYEELLKFISLIGNEYIIIES